MNLATINRVVHMQGQKRNPTILFLSLPLALCLLYTSTIGSFTVDFYARETLNWQAQSIGQDLIDLFLLAPFLVLTAILAWKGNKTALLLWAGANLYLVYTFCLFCFDVHFNSLFIFYCINLGLSFYSVLYFIFLQLHGPFPNRWTGKTPMAIIGVYFIIIAIIFYALWLSEIIPSLIYNTIPKSLEEVGLPTNGVHVLDLSVFLPGIFITGVLLLKKKTIALILAPVLLTFFILMDITIGGLMIFMQQRGLEVQLEVSYVMAGLAFVSLVLLVWYFIELNKNPGNQNS